ncbi:MAG: hypothetical protein CYPHOPRED_000638 [Cyphobasidiales sp. Tagirdzhanova-0007]|nr:MAG: hypothetical protein CYPHOPRED_000638 [Cyphobasidiales sp. Tagirdzhanova-0007]
MHSNALSLGPLLLAFVALSTHTAAFHVESGTSCSTPGAACTCTSAFCMLCLIQTQTNPAPPKDISDDASTGGSASTVVNGFCASDNICASNGAKCSDNNACYNYCGTDGLCGGAGAGCNTQSLFSAGQSGIACADDFTCTENGSVGVCKPSSQVTLSSASPASSSLAESTSSATTGSSLSNPSSLARRAKRRMPFYHHRQVRAADLRKHI